MSQEFSPNPDSVRLCINHVIEDVAPQACERVLDLRVAYIGGWMLVEEYDKDKVFIINDGYAENGEQRHTFGLSFVGPTYRLSCSVYHEPAYMEDRGGLPGVYDPKCEFKGKNGEYLDVMDLYDASPNTLLGIERLLFGFGIRIEKLLTGYREPINYKRISPEYEEENQDWFT